MGVADGDRAVAHGIAEVLGHRRSDHPASCADVGDVVERVGQRSQQPGAARVVERQRAHHTVEYLDVVCQGLGLGVDDHERRLTEPVQQEVAGGVE